ncbi:MAG: NAD(P)H-binding protein [Myxococcota bacterium]
MTQPSQHPVPQPSCAPSKPHLAVFGATRGIGRHVVDFALQSGHRVTALARDPTALELGDDRLRVVGGDATDADAVARAVAGADAVVCALGAPARNRDRVRARGTENIIAAMARQGVQRLLCVSVLGAAETRGDLPWFLRYLFFPLYLRQAVADHEAQERLIAASSLRWTIVRPPHLTDGPRTDEFQHGEGSGGGAWTLKISRADVAGFMLDQLGRDDYVGRRVGVSY